MCIIIDACTVSRVFNGSNRQHSAFKPVLEWLLLGNGRMVVGGSAYYKEMRKLEKYLPLMSELSKLGKTIPLNSKDVDSLEAAIIKQKKHRTFDDAHLVAMVNKSGCKVVCTSDTRANSHLKDKKLYHNGVHKPSLYTSERNADLLTDKYIPKCYKSRCVLSKKLQSGIKNILIKLAQ